MKLTICLSIAELALPRSMAASWPTHANNPTMKAPIARFCRRSFDGSNAMHRPFGAGGWLWIAKAKNGKPADLLAKPSRKWAIDSLADGRPDTQIIAVLRQAEIASGPQQKADI